MKRQRPGDNAEHYSVKRHKTEDADGNGPCTPSTPPSNLTSQPLALTEEAPRLSKQQSTHETLESFIRSWTESLASGGDLDTMTAPSTPGSGLSRDRGRRRGGIRTPRSRTPSPSINHRHKRTARKTCILLVGSHYTSFGMTVTAFRSSGVFSHVIGSYWSNELPELGHAAITSRQAPRGTPTHCITCTDISSGEVS